MRTRLFTLKAASMPSVATTCQHDDPPVVMPASTPEFVSPPASVSVEARLAALELKAHYDGELIAKLSRQLEQAGEVIDALVKRVNSLASQVESLRGGMSIPPAFQHPDGG